MFKYMIYKNLQEQKLNTQSKTYQRLDTE